MKTHKTLSRWTRGATAAGGALALAAAGMAGMTTTASAEDGTFRVGVVAFLSGNASGPFGIPARNAAEVVIEGINNGDLPAPYDTAGLNGLTIDPVYIDENGGTSQQVEEFRNLVQRRDVDAVVGYTSSGNCLAIGPVAEELEMLTIAFDCGTPRLFDEVESPQYLFRTGLDATADNIGAVRYLQDTRPDVTRIAGIQQNYAWGQDSWRDFQASLDTLMPDTEIVAEQMPQIFQGNYGSEISALQTSRPEIVHSSFWGGDMEAFVTQANARGLLDTATALLTTGESAFHRFEDRAPDGTILGGRGPYGVFAPDNELNRWFTDAYVEAHGEQPSYPSHKMAQALLGLKHAVDNAGADAGAKPERDAIVETLRGASFESVSGTVGMDRADGHQAVQDMVYGEYHYDSSEGPRLENVIHYDAECVTAPEGEDPVEWIEAGFPGVDCE